MNNEYEHLKESIEELKRTINDKGNEIIKFNRTLEELHVLNKPKEALGREIQKLVKTIEEKDLTLTRYHQLTEQAINSYAHFLAEYKEGGKNHPDGHFSEHELLGRYQDTLLSAWQMV